MLTYLNVTGLNTNANPPTVGIVFPLSPKQRTATPITFICVATDADRVVFDFGDGNTASGQTVTHEYALGTTFATVTCTATNAAGSTSTTMELSLTNPTCVWQDASGTYHALPDIRLGSRDGWSGNTGDIAAVENTDYTGEIIARVAGKRREIMLTMPISGATKTDKENKLADWLDVFAQGKPAGKFIFCKANGDIRYITAKVSRGYPEEEELSNTFSWMRVGLTAADPYWYGWDELTIYPVGGTITVTNSGNVPAPCEYEIAANSCANTTTGETLTANESNIVGVIITSGQDAVTATDGTTNVLYKFTLDSQFWMLRPGTNVITGAAYVKFRPRWSGI